MHSRKASTCVTTITGLDEVSFFYGRHTRRFLNAEFLFVNQLYSSEGRGRSPCFSPLTFHRQGSYHTLPWRGFSTTETNYS